METSILEELGLSKGEVKIYLTLLKLGKTKVGEVIEKSGMASSAVHNSIKSLIDKGLVSYVKQGKIKFYQAVSPKQLVDFLNNKKKRLLGIIPKLEEQQNLSKEKQEAEIFLGINGVTSMLNLLIENAKKGDEYLFFAVNVELKNKEIQDFFEMFDIKRKEKGLVVKGLASKEMKEFFVKRKILKMKYVDFPIPSNISICKNKVAMFSWDEKPVGYLIKSKQIAEMYKEFFRRVWEVKNPNS